MDDSEIKYFVEAALLAAGRPLTIDQLQALFDVASMPDKAQIKLAIDTLLGDYKERGITIAEVASGFRMQVKQTMADRLQKLWEERPPRYSRALFETLALIAYRQPLTRGEIEEVRGVSVSSNIMRSLLERDWVRVVGHRDVPGRPAMFGTTKTFLDYFGLKKLDDLPALADLADWESLRIQLNLPEVGDENDEELDFVDTPAETVDSATAIAEEGFADDRGEPALDPDEPDVRDIDPESDDADEPDDGNSEDDDELEEEDRDDDRSDDDDDSDDEYDEEFDEDDSDSDGELDEEDDEEFDDDDEESDEDASDSDDEPDEKSNDDRKAL